MNEKHKDYLMFALDLVLPLLPLLILGLAVWIDGRF